MKKTLIALALLAAGSAFAEPGFLPNCQRGKFIGMYIYAPTPFAGRIDFDPTKVCKGKPDTPNLFEELQRRQPEREKSDRLPPVKEPSDGRIT